MRRDSQCSTGAQAQAQPTRSWLGLADEADTQEPDRQREFDVLHQTAGRPRGLVSATATLAQFAGSVANNIVVWPRHHAGSGNRQASAPVACLNVLRFDIKAAQRFLDRHAKLEFESVGWSWGELRHQQHTDYDLTRSRNEPCGDRFLVTFF